MTRIAKRRWLPELDDAEMRDGDDFVCKKVSSAVPAFVDRMMGLYNKHKEEEEEEE